MITSGVQMNQICVAPTPETYRLIADQIGGYSRVGGDELMTWRDYFRGEIAGHQPP